ncbi:hypothetical protein Q8A73_016244 [Channa argus]|nr:hypothetical protein Q8A73_016244 [Channa argus]
MSCIPEQSGHNPESTHYVTPLSTCLISLLLRKSDVTVVQPEHTKLKKLLELETGNTPTGQRSHDITRQRLQTYGHNPGQRSAGAGLVATEESTNKAKPLVLSELCKQQIRQLDRESDSAKSRGE